MSAENATILASTFANRSIKTKENISIVFVSRDNKSLAINVTSSLADADNGFLPGSITISTTPPQGFRVLCRLVSDKSMTTKLFSDTSKCRIISNSIDDRLKAYTILSELERCL